MPLLLNLGAAVATLHIISKPTGQAPTFLQSAGTCCQRVYQGGYQGGIVACAPKP